MRFKPYLILTVSFAVFFALGRWSATPPVESKLVAVTESERMPFQNLHLSASATQTDSIRATASSTERSADALSDFDVSKPDVRESIDSIIRRVPFSFLKEIYTDREIADSKKAEELYETVKSEDEEGRKRLTEDLFALYQRNGNGDSYFTTTTEWTLRNGKKIPVTLAGQLYTSRVPVEDEEGGAWIHASTTADASQATKGEELCYMVSAYFKTGDAKGSKYSSEGTGSCLSWTAIQQGTPFVLLNSNSKGLMPYFDRVSVPLPGFGTDIAAQPRWFDSNRGSWSALSKVRWESVSKTEFQQTQKDLQAEVIPNY